MAQQSLEAAEYRTGDAVDAPLTPQRSVVEVGSERLLSSDEEAAPKRRRFRGKPRRKASRIKRLPVSDDDSDGVVAGIPSHMPPAKEHAAMSSSCDATVSQSRNPAAVHCVGMMRRLSASAIKVISQAAAAAAPVPQAEAAATDPRPQATDPQGVALLYEGTEEASCLRYPEGLPQVFGPPCVHTPPGVFEAAGRCTALPSAAAFPSPTRSCKSTEDKGVQAFTDCSASADEAAVESENQLCHPSSPLPDEAPWTDTTGHSMASSFFASSCSPAGTTLFHFSAERQQADSPCRGARQLAKQLQGNSASASDALPAQLLDGAPCASDAPTEVARARERAARGRERAMNAVLEAAAQQGAPASDVPKDAARMAESQSTPQPSRGPKRPYKLLCEFGAGAFDAARRYHGVDVD